MQPSRSPRAIIAELASLAALAAPLVAGLVLSTGITVVDTAMLAPLGAVPLAAVSLAQSVIIVFYAALYGFTGPVGIFAGLKHGEGAHADIGRVARHGVVLALGAGGLAALMMASLLWALPYLGQPTEVLAVIGPYWLCVSAMLVPFTLSLAGKALFDATDQPWLGVALIAVPVGLNVLFNWMFIGGNLGAPALGLTGAGVASLLAQTLGTLVLWGMVRWSPRLAPWWRGERWMDGGFRLQLREGVPMTIQYFMEGGAVAIIGVIIGLFGVVALAGNQIALAVGNVLYMLPLGVAGAVTIRVAQASGAGETGRVPAIGLAGVSVTTVWMGLFAILCLLAGEAMARLFIDDPAVVAAAAAIFFVFGFTQLMDGVQSVSLGALRGMLDNVWPTVVSIIAYWLVALPLAWVFGVTMGYGAPGVWAGFGVGLGIAAVALFSRFIHLTRVRGRAA